MLSNPDLWMQSPTLSRVFQILEAMGLKDYVFFDPQVIRGWILHWDGF